MDASQAVSSELTDSSKCYYIRTAYSVTSHTVICHRYDINDMISGKLQLQLVPDEGQSHIMGDIDLKVGAGVTPMAGVYECAHLSRLLQGRDWNSQIKLGNGGFYGMSLPVLSAPDLLLYPHIPLW